MEGRFGHDFAGVRLHTGDLAARSARAVQARAYTVGNDVILGEGLGQLGGGPGRKVLMHELAHVVQHARAPQDSSTGLVVGDAQDPAEREADAVAQAADGLVDEAQVSEDEILVDGPIPDVISGAHGKVLRQGVSRMPTIRVVANHQFPITAANVAAGVRSGCGGVSEIEVSDGAGTVFDGSQISEMFVGEGGDIPQIGGCNNASGKGGQGGSTFTVGTGVSFSQVGININLPAKTNTFYDVHIKALRVNVLPAGVDRGYSSCLQQYTWGISTLNNGQIFNRWHNIVRGSVAGVDVANIDLEKS